MLSSKSSLPILVPLLFLFLFLLLLSPPSSAHDLPTVTPECPFSKVISFGDSFTDTGNAKFLGGLIAFAKALVEGSPYGSTFFKDKPSNRLCDGRLVIDFLAETLKLPSFIPPYKDTSANFSFGVNFAVAGSTSLPGNFFNLNRVGRPLPWKDVPESIQLQIDWFNEFMSGEHGSSYKADMHNVLFWIGEMGGNDYLRTFGHSLKVESLTQMAVDHVCKILKTCLDHGAKFIVVQSLPPSGCSPLDLLLAPHFDRDTMGCAGSANAVIQAHNRLLQQKLKEYEKQYPDCMILYADYWGAYQQIIENPKLHGFEEPFKACCGAGGGLFNFDMHSVCGSSGTAKCADPSKYINWDGVHLTEAMYKKISELFFTKGFCKPSFDDLLKRKLSFLSGGGGGGGGASVGGGVESGSQGQGQVQQSGQIKVGGGAGQSVSSGGGGDSGSQGQGQQSSQNKAEGGAQQSTSSGGSSGSEGQGEQSSQKKAEGGTQQSTSSGASSGSQGQGEQSAQNKAEGGAQQSTSGSGSGSDSGSGSASSGSQGQGQQSSQNKAEGGSQQSASGGASSESQGQGQQSTKNKAEGGSEQSASGGSSSGSQGQGQQSAQPNKAEGGSQQSTSSGGGSQGQQSSENKADGGAQQSGKSGGSFESHGESQSSYEYNTGGGNQQSGNSGSGGSGGGGGGKSDMHFKGQKAFQYKTEDGMNVSCSCTYS